MLTYFELGAAISIAGNEGVFSTLKLKSNDLGVSAEKSFCATGEAKLALASTETVSTRS